MCSYSRRVAFYYRVEDLFSYRTMHRCFYKLGEESNTLRVAIVRMVTNRTMRIAIYNSDKTEGRKIFELTKDVMRTNRHSGELSVFNDLERIIERLQLDIFYYDIYILDSKDEECMELAKIIRSRNCVSSILFCNETEDEINDIVLYRPSFLLQEDKIISLLKHAIKHAYDEQQRYHPYFPIKNKDNMMRIYYDDILFFESRQKVCVLHTQKQDIEFYAKMSDVETMLPQSEFNRCHQSYLVNMKNVIRLDKSNRCFVLPMGYTIGISKANYAESVASYEGYIEGI